VKLNHESEYICVCERWDEPVLYPVAELIRCRECKLHGTNGDRLNCAIFCCTMPDDGFCSCGERKEE
jgi:hypothetical protein